MPLPSSPEKKSLLLKSADRIDGLIGKICHLVLLVTGTILMLALTANVLARYLLAAGGFDWAEEIPEQMFPWFIMAGVALAVQHLGHVAVEWLLGKITRETTRLVLLAGHALVIAAYCLLMVQALQVADIVAIERSPVLGLPKTYGYWAIATGSLLVAVSTMTGAMRLYVIGPEALRSTLKPEAMI